MQLREQGIDGDYLTAGRMGERLDDTHKLAEVDDELWLRVRGRGDDGRDRGRREARSGGG